MALPAFPDVDLPLLLEAAFGADLNADPLTWEWTDLSARLPAAPVVVSRGRDPGATEPAAATCTATLDNDDGQLTPLHPASQWYPFVDMGTPIRVTVNRNLNPGFEESAEDWTATGGSVARSTAQAHDGVASLLLTPDGVTATAVARSGLVPVAPGRSWIVSGWVYSPAGYGDNAGIAVELLDGAHQPISLTQAAAPGLPAAEWVYQELWFTAPAGAAFARVCVTVADSPTGSDTLHADLVRLRSVRFAGTADAWQPTFLPKGGGEFTSTVTITASGTSRRHGQGSPVLRSAMRRAVSTTGSLGSTHLLDPVAYWPLEDAAGSTSGASALPGGPAMRQSGSIDWATADVAAGSAPLPDLRNSTGTLTGTINGVTGDWLVGFLLSFDGSNIWTPVHLLLDGGDPYVELRITVDTVIQVFGVDGDGATTFLFQVSADLSDGRPTWCELWAKQDTGSTYTLELVVGDLLLAGIGGAAGVRGVPRRAVLRRRSSGGVATVGHVGVWSTPQLVRGLVEPAVDGYADEPARDRARRLCREQRVSLELVGDTLLVSDQFGRTVPAGWGSAPTGQAWTTTAVAGTVDFAVTPGVATMTRTSGSGVAVATVAENQADVEILVALALDADTAAAGPVRWMDANNFIAWSITGGATANIALQVSVAGVPSSRTATRVGGFTPGVTYWVRGQQIGPQLRIRVWADGEEEPSGWALALTRSGAVDVAAAADIGVLTSTLNGAVVTFSHVDVVAVTPSELMGAQQPGTLLDLLGQVETTDDGLLYEHAFGFGYLLRHARYNRARALAVDMSTYQYSGQADQVLTPILDDQRVANTVLVERVGGSSAIAQDAVHVARYLAYEQTLPVNVASDLRLLDRAGWEVGKGTVREMRAATRQINLAGNPDLIDGWLGVELGDRIARTNLPAVFPPPQDVDKVLVGYTETLAPDRWLVSDQGTPYTPWQVGVYADDTETPAPDAPSRYDTAGSRSVGDFQAGTDTNLEVATTLGQLWTVDPDDLPLDISCAGVRLRATDIDLPDPTLRATTGTASGTTGAFTVDSPAGVQAGDLLLLWHAADLATIAEMGNPSGGTWELLGDAESGDSAIRVWWRVAGSSEPGTYGLTQPANADGVAIVAAVQHARPAPAPIRAIAVDPASSANVDTPSTTVHRGDYASLELRVACGTPVGSPSTYTPPGGFVEQEQHDSGGFIAAALATRTTGEGGTGVHTFTTSVNVLDKRGVTINVVGTQQMTVQQQPVNGVAKVIPAGSELSLWTPAPYAL